MLDLFSSCRVYAIFNEKAFLTSNISLILITSAKLVSILPVLFWFRTKYISGHYKFYSAKAPNLSILDFNILLDSLSRFPFVLIRTKSETAKQNSTNFESKSFLLAASFLLTTANNPYVSIKNIPSQFGKFMFENLK